MDTMPTIPQQLALIRLGVTAERLRYMTKRRASALIGELLTQKREERRERLTARLADDNAAFKVADKIRNTLLVGGIEEGDERNLSSKRSDCMHRETTVVKVAVLHSEIATYPAD